jgi:hypothetical protein
MLAIDKFDLNKTPIIGPEHQAEFLRAALPNGTMTVAMDPNTLKSELYELTIDGSFNVSMAGMPTGKATARLKGLDKTLETLQTAAASDPSVQQAIGPLLAAKGFAKVEDSQHVWVFESNGAGGFLVNGIDLSRM